MRSFVKSTLPLCLCIQLLVWSSQTNAGSCVVLLHGLARTSSSMQELAEALSVAGFSTSNIDYPSRTAKIEKLALNAVPRGLADCRLKESDTIHFVTHSLGGILVRQYLAEHVIDELGRVVMLAPPNHGSEVVDALSDIPGYEFLNGPAGQQLGTGPDSVPNRLGGVAFDLGVIAGTSTFNPILSQLLPNPDDGKVSVESARVAGMCGFLTLPYTHTFIMQSEEVAEQVIHYLKQGRFDHLDAESHDCSN